MKKLHRVFIAINFPPEIKRMIADYQKQWQDLPARWVSFENLHITLAFLGNITDQEIGEVCMAVKKITESNESFNLKLESIGYGPTGKMPYKMVWLRGEKSKELSSLKNGLEKELEVSVRFKPEARGFSLHVTLARINQMQLRNMDLEEIPAIHENIDVDFEVESIDVMESVLTKEGPRYTIIESFPLKLKEYEE